MPILLINIGHLAVRLLTVCSIIVVQVVCLYEIFSAVKGRVAIGYDEIGYRIMY